MLPSSSSARIVSVKTVPAMLRIRRIFFIVCVSSRSAA
jgi:hypothetical protein